MDDGIPEIPEGDNWDAAPASEITSTHASIQVLRGPVMADRDLTIAAVILQHG